MNGHPDGTRCLIIHIAREIDPLPFEPDFNVGDVVTVGKEVSPDCDQDPFGEWGPYQEIVAHNGVDIRCQNYQWLHEVRWLVPIWDGDQDAISHEKQLEIA